jgi:hypothetical protein
MDTNDCQEYLNRWKLVAVVEQQEIRKASFKLMLHGCQEIFRDSQEI